MNIPFWNRNPRRWRVLYQKEGAKVYTMSNGMRKEAALDHLDIFKDAIMVVEISTAKVYNGSNT